jgi:hypothetical protein
LHLNCIFDNDCKITVDDLASHFLPPAATGDAFLQSRLWPIGEMGTPGAGLYAYLYRIDLRNARGVTAAACVTTMQIDFGPIAPLDYNGDSKSDHVFVITNGGLGNIKPAAATQSGGAITFHFDPSICVGGRTGDSSFFFGLASTQPADLTQTHLTGSIGLDHTLQAKAPRRAGADIAYIHADDTGSAAAFESLLTGEGYSVQLVHMKDVSTTKRSILRCKIGTTTPLSTAATGPNASCAWKAARWASSAIRATAPPGPTAPWPVVSSTPPGRASYPKAAPTLSAAWGTSSTMASSTWRVR